MCSIVENDVCDQAREKFRIHFGEDPTVGAYAPGRAEILGNHTDYNEGYVLSSAINYGTVFLAAPEQGDCRLVAGDLMQEVTFPLAKPRRFTDCSWPNYVLGVSAELEARAVAIFPFKALFFGDVPRGAGLSSSAALSMSAAVALTRLYSGAVDLLEMARIGQKAENEYVGVRTGLLDQISSLHGRENQLVMTDFRSLAVETVPMNEEFCFIACNTRVKHSLVDSAYNERRSACEAAAAFFADRLDHPVEALRDVSMEEWERCGEEMDPIVSRRAAHVIGENERVLAGRELLREGRIGDFGHLMFDSHESSRLNFENSCGELDFLVQRAAEHPAVLGARLSGGGFGGSVIMLIPSEAVEAVSGFMHRTYAERFDRPCGINVIEPSEGAHLLND